MSWLGIFAGIGLAVTIGACLHGCGPTGEINVPCLPDEACAVSPSRDAWWPRDADAGDAGNADLDATETKAQE